MKLAVQQTLIPGDTFAQKLSHLEKCGYGAVELVYREVEGNERETAAALAGSPIEASSMCPSVAHDLADPTANPEERVGFFKRSLDLAARLGAKVFISVPVRGPLREGVTREFESQAYVDALGQVGEHAESLGITVVIEPLIRYETHLINRLEQAVEIARRVDSPSVRVMADFFHMNVEEADVGASIRDSMDWIAHVHLADSNRLNPGRGHTNFGPGLEALRKAGFAGALALECRLAGDPLDELRYSAEFLRPLLN